jgi:hypothetical protein
MLISTIIIIIKSPGASGRSLLVSYKSKKKDVFYTFLVCLLHCIECLRNVGNFDRLIHKRINFRPVKRLGIL